MKKILPALSLFLFTFQAKAQSEEKLFQALCGEWKCSKISLEGDYKIEYDAITDKLDLGGLELVMQPSQIDSMYQPLSKGAKNSYLKINRDLTFEMKTNGKTEKGKWYLNTTDNEYKFYFHLDISEQPLMSINVYDENNIQYEDQAQFYTADRERPQFTLKYWGKNGSPTEGYTFKKMGSAAKTGSTPVKPDKPAAANQQKWNTEPGYKFNSINPFKEGLAAVSTGSDFTGSLSKKWGFINPDGKLVVPVKYDLASDFDNGLAMVALNHKYGFINTTGKIVIPLTWDNASGFSEGLAAVAKNGLYGFINTEGKVVIPLVHYNAYNFREGLAPVLTTKGKWGCINKMGNIVVETKYDNIPEFHEGFSKVKLGNKFAFIDKTGSPLTDFIYEDASYFSDGLAAVQLNGAFGFIDKQGKEVIPFDYEYAYPFSSGSAQVKDNKKYGLINKQGQTILAIKYDNISGFHEQKLARIKINGKYGFITTAGTEVIPPKYDDAGFFSEGLIGVSINGKWGYIDEEGNTMISFQFDNATDFSGGLAEVETNGKWFTIDKTGKKWTGKK